MLRLFSAITLAIGIWTIPLPTLAADEIDLDTIRHRLEEWRREIVNLRMVWERRSMKMPNQAALPEWTVPGSQQEYPLSSRSEWIWTDRRMELLELGSFSSRDGRRTSVTTEVFNGQKGIAFRASYDTPSDGAETLKDLLIYKTGAGAPFVSSERLPLRGLYWLGGAQWLPEKLMEWTWTFEGIEDVAGSRCARIATVDQTHRAPSLLRIKTLWLDLEHDCLVRRYRNWTIPESGSGTDFMVDEFQRLEKGIWFPKRGRRQLQGSAEPYENQLWEVTEVAINELLDHQRFEPPAPQIGTIVTDGDKTYTYGEPRAAKAAGEPTNGGGELLTPTSSVRPAQSVMPRGLALSGVVLVVTLLCVVAGFLFSRKT